MRNRLFDIGVALRASAAVARESRRARSGPVDLFLALMDHYEPHVGRVSDAVARERHSDWLRRYAEIAGRHRDADGRHPAHGYFYPWDEFDPWEMERLAEHCAEGWGEIEVHLHHQNDTEATLRRKLREAVRVYREHGALSAWPDGRPAWGFIHGNWALDNSRCEAGVNHCGVNSELTVLQEEGCFADFTFPSWQHLSQPRAINSIYYAVDDPRPKSYDRGTPAQAGVTARPGLLLVQGPLVPHRRDRGFGVDDGDLAASPGRRYSPERLDRWVRAGIHVAGRPDRVFIKLHCHGAQDRNREALLGGDLDALFSDAEARYNDGERFRLHYVTAREMFNVIRATEAEAPGGIGALRDYVLPPPPEARVSRDVVGASSRG